MIQSRGHANPGLQFRREGWYGEKLSGGAWRNGNVDVHVEVELVEGGPWPLRVHFETSPYRTQAQIKKMRNGAGFSRARDAFREALHAQHAALRRWKMSHRPLQQAKCDIDVGGDATVGEWVAACAPRLREIGEAVDKALRLALYRLQSRARGY